MTKKNMTPVIVLAAICIAAALLLSVINLFTAPKIAENKNKAAFESLAEVLPDGKNFKQLTLDDKYPSNITEVYTADGGFVFRSTGMGGKNGDIDIMIGISTDGKIVGTKVIATSETPGYADPVYSQVGGTNGKYTGQTLESFQPIIIAGSTVTSKAYANAVEAALKAYVVANGGTVDTRTPEEILQDNCNTALGTTGVKFTKWFATASLNGVDAVYESTEGRVYLIGESFVGIKDAMVVTADATEENKAAALQADVIVTSNIPTDISASLDAIKDALANEKNAKITAVSKTESGNYVFTLKANGHAVKGDHGSGVQMEIKVSISADGKIIDVLTLKQDESKDIGDVCQTEEYYEQYKGKADEDIKVSSDKYAIDYSDDYIAPDCTDVGVIAGATNTTIGYQKAVKLAFLAFELLTEGGSN